MTRQASTGSHDDHAAPREKVGSQPGSAYTRFGVMIAVSTAIMLVLMYLTTYQWDHVAWSETRAYMALLMGATMALVMLAFMLHMYTSRTANIAIAATAVVVWSGSLYLVRSQATVDDLDYMKAMIPHHSIAVLTSRRARIEDPRVRKLADQIIATQMREIAEMKALISELGSRKDAAGR